MKQHLLFVFISLLAFMAKSQGKISPAASLILESYRLEKAHRSNATNASSSDSDRDAADSNAAMAIVVLDSENDVWKISEAGFSIEAVISNKIVVNIPYSRAEELAAMECVRYVDFGEILQPMMDYARPSGNVNAVQDGFSHNGSSQSYDGTGVICGMMDTGFDPNHINFKNTDGTSRISRLWFMKSYDGSYDEYTASNISDFETDKPTETHATHVAGIMAGGYKGPGTYAYISSASGKSVSEMNGNIPFYGVATGSDIAAAVGELYNANTLVGVQKIIEYAESQGKPAVINLSLGSTSGPHDGTDAYTSALSDLGQRAIICMSAGNDGDIPISIVKTLSEASLSVKTMLSDNKGSGIVDVWANNNIPLNVKWAVYNTANRQLTDLISISEADKIVNMGNNATFTSYFTGSIRMVSLIDPNNNRYRVYSDISVSPKSETQTFKLALIVEGKAGQTVYVYGNSKTSFNANSLVGWDDGSTANSINNAACGENIISVGAYTSRTTWGVFGSRYGYYDGTFSLNGICPFSSYGKSFQGVQHPLITAPGAGIISSFSRFYVNKKNSASDMTARVTDNGIDNYWYNMQGTSMSCPFVSGTIGLWLQADPTLNYDRVLDVINNTSVFNKMQQRPAARWGAGKIDALKGIQYVLDNRAAIGDVWADADERLIVTATADGYEVYMAGAADITATLYDLQGRPVASARGTYGTATVNASSLQSGIYILRASTPTASLSRKVTKN